MAEPSCQSLNEWIIIENLALGQISLSPSLSLSLTHTHTGLYESKWLKPGQVSGPQLDGTRGWTVRGFDGRAVVPLVEGVDHHYRLHHRARPLRDTLCKY